MLYHVPVTCYLRSMINDKAAFLIDIAHWAQWEQMEHTAGETFLGNSLVKK